MTEGDWNGDGLFNQLDIIAALQTGNYLQGPYASLAKSDRDAEVLCWSSETCARHLRVKWGSLRGQSDEVRAILRVKAASHADSE